MKKLYTIIVLSLLMSCTVYKDTPVNTKFAQTMKPLKEYVIENKGHTGNVIFQTYLLKRCGAAYAFAGAIYKDTNPDVSKVFFKSYKDVSFLAGQALMEKLGWSEQEATESVIGDIKIMLKFYKKDGYAWFARTGQYFSNNYIGEDLKFCKKIAEIAD